jgi:hypothetical protein
MGAAFPLTALWPCTTSLFILHIATITTGSGLHKAPIALSFTNVSCSLPILQCTLQALQLFLDMWGELAVRARLQLTVPWLSLGYITPPPTHRFMVGHLLCCSWFSLEYNCVISRQKTISLHRFWPQRLPTPRPFPSDDLPFPPSSRPPFSPR